VVPTSLFSHHTHQTLRKGKGFIYNELQAVTGKVPGESERNNNQADPSFQVVFSIPHHLLDSSSDLILVEHRPAGHIVAPGQLFQAFAY
jgi:hypothetical protein